MLIETVPWSMKCHFAKLNTCFLLCVLWQVFTQSEKSLKEFLNLNLSNLDPSKLEKHVLGKFFECLDFSVI